MLCRNNTFEYHKVSQEQITKPLPEGIKLDVRIIIFGQNAVMSTFTEDSVNSTIISSPEVANSLRSLFISIWNQSPTDLPGHPDRNIQLNF